MSDQPTLKQAMILVSRRKLAVAAKHGTDSGITIRISEESARQVLIGTDLSLEEVSESAANAIKASAAALIMDDMDPLTALASEWVDGVLVGLMLAELRAKASLSEQQQIREAEAEMRRRNG